MVEFTTASILQKQLETARQEIATLRKVVDHTVAIIAGAGGRVEVPTSKHDEGSKLHYRHESDGTTHIFTVGGDQ